MHLADRLDRIPPYLFMELRKKIAAAKAAGVDVISLAVGDPVEPTPDSVIEELCTQARDPANHPYPPDEEKGMLTFRRAVARWYRDRYAVGLDPQTEVLGLIGSKEGVHHFALSRVNPGDVVLMTDPGYPAYRASILMAGGEPHTMAMLPERGYLPTLKDVPSEVAGRATAMFLNYPNNPTGALASPQFFADVVAFARAHDIAVCHDNPYSEIVFDGAQRLSFLSVPGAMDVGIELNSLSKPYNMTGWRIGMAVGNRDLIAGLSKVKENTDSGIFAPVQYAAIKALEAEDANIAKMLGLYAARRALVVDTFRALGWRYEPPKGTFYLWIPTRDGASSSDFAALLLERAGVVVAPGAGYGRHGEGFIRISLTVPDARLREAMDRITKALS